MNSLTKQPYQRNITEQRHQVEWYKERIARETEYIPVEEGVE
jgi:hypothetical protein